MRVYFPNKPMAVLATSTVAFSFVASAMPSWASVPTRPSLIVVASSRGPAIPPVSVPASADGRKVKIEAKYPVDDCAYNKTSAGYEPLDVQLVASQRGRIVASGSEVKLPPGKYSLKVTLTYRTCRNATSVVAVPQGLYTLGSADHCDVTAVSLNRAEGPPLMAVFTCVLGGGDSLDEMQNYYVATGSVGYQWNQPAQHEYDGDMYLDDKTGNLEYADDGSTYDPEEAPGALYFDEWIEEPGTITLPAQNATKNNWTWGPTQKKSVVQSITISSRNSPCVSEGEPGRLRLGMTIGEVASLIGYGGHRAFYLNQGGSIAETRTYEWCAYSNVLYVYFRDGRVSGWLDS